MKTVRKIAAAFYHKLCEKSYGWSVILSKLLYFHYRKDSAINTSIQRYAANAKGIGLSEKKLKQTLLANRAHYKITYDEYFMFRFYDLNDKGKRLFVGDYERKELLNGIGTEKSRELFDQKDQTYEHFQKYYKRKALKVTGEGGTDRKNYISFIESHEEFMVKALNKGCGQGIYKVRKPDISFNEENLYEKIKNDGGALLEEVIEQAPDLSSFHPESVNTIRIATLNNKGTISLLFAFIRIGREKSVVDNGGAGGIIASIDLETGIIDTYGITEDMNEYLFHPDTGKQIAGYRIPRWKEAVDLAIELAGELPEHPCVGWDLALTREGWVMVEGNRRTMLVGPQLTRHKGCRDLVDRYFT
ncbi:MAG: hypothetical protein II888_00855 [Clostridia bacterium]|nr:hypothetical protein [Clostridia bacterium]